MILWSADYLGQKEVESARLQAEHLLAHTLGLGRLELYLQYDRPLTPEELDRFRPLLKRRAAREPLQYIVGHQPFRELDLEVTPAVLIPRPETEFLVAEVLAWVAERSDGQASAVLDVGTGSGAIALSLAFEGSFARVLATDVSEEALEVARRNRDAAGLHDAVEFRHGASYAPLRDGERFDVVVSNPPYVAESDEPTLEPEVVDWEPRGALFGGVDGLTVVEELVAGADSALVPNGLFALEIGAGQASSVTALLRATGSFRDVRVRKDYAGKERVVLAQRA